MTLPLRRKRPITAPSTPTAKPGSATRIIPSPSAGAMKPQHGGCAVRVRPMPALVLAVALWTPALAAADPNPSGWHAKGREKSKAHSAQFAEQARDVEGVRRVSLNAAPQQPPAPSGKSLSWRRPTMVGEQEPSHDLGPRLLKPAVVRDARRVSAETEIDAPQLGAAQGHDSDDDAPEDPFDDWGQSVIEAQRVASRPFQEEALPPLDQPSGAAPPPSTQRPPRETTPPVEPRRLTPQQGIPELQRQVAQLPPCPNPEDLRKISEITDDITPPGTEFPPECELARAGFEPRAWAETTYTWKASGLCHKPLYFEDVQLERYGHTCGPLLQPFASGAHFFGNALILPYKMGMEPPCECVYALGYYRPGDCAPFMIQPLGLSWQGAFWQGTTVTGLVFLIP